MRATHVHARGTAPGGAERPIQSITSAPLSLREDQRHRLRNYLISMTIRTVCFALAGVFAIATDWTPAAWICVVAAALLPYPAVIFANNVDRRSVVTSPQMPRLQLEATHREAITRSEPAEAARGHAPPESGR